MYARMSGAKKPPAPATSGAWNGIGDREAPRRVALALLLVRDGEHALVHARRHELRRDDRSRAADTARGVHAHHRLAHRAERVGEVELGHRDALEHVGRLADDDGVDVAPRHARVFERLDRGLAHEPGHRDVLRATTGGGSDRSRRRLRVARPSIRPPGRRRGSAAGTGPTSRARRRGRASPAVMRVATSPMRERPAAMITFAASGPPDGLIDGGVAETERVAQDELLVRELRVQLRDVDLAVADPAATAAARVDSEVARSRTPSECASMRCSMPRIHAGRSHTVAGDVAGRDHHRGRAVAHREHVAARAAGRSVTGATEQRVGGRIARRAPRAGSSVRCAARAAATSARSRSVRPDSSRYARACSAAMSIHRRPQRHHVVRVGLQRHDLGDVAEARPSRTRRSAPSRPRRSGSRPTPRRAPRPRPSRRGSPGSAATRRPRRRPATNANGPPKR